ncbi:MAG: DHH family phosphoesterase, partial [Alistipes sp.]|nr:DHH family phosphoesterase [Candidatus Minthomonas equi]
IMTTITPSSTFESEIILLDTILRSSSRIAVIGHNNPDGDSVGSATAMYNYITGRGGECRALLPSTIPGSLGFLDPEQKILYHSVKEGARGFCASPEETVQTIHDADLIICLDLNSPNRTEGLESALRTAKCKKVLIDHHPAPEKDFFDLIFSDTDISSACELLFWILMKMPDIDGDISKMDYSVAISLATGLITDTNNFCNSAVPSTFKMASLLLERGVDLESIYMRVFGSYSEMRMKLMGEMLSGMLIDRESHSACMVLTKEAQRKFGFRPGDSEGFVNLGLKIADVEVSVLFTEEKDRIRVSLRSKGAISVNRLSGLFFNGGGHEKASGGRLEIPVRQVQEYWLSSIREFIRREGINSEGMGSER